MHYRSLHIFKQVYVSQLHTDQIMHNDLALRESRLYGRIHGYKYRKCTAKARIASLHISVQSVLVTVTRGYRSFSCLLLFLFHDYMFVFCDLLYLMNWTCFDVIHFHNTSHCATRSRNAIVQCHRNGLHVTFT